MMASVEAFSDDIPEASWDLYEMIQALFQAPSYHLLFEAALILWIVRMLFFTKSYKPERTNLSAKEKEELIQDWQPEPLVPESNEAEDLGLYNIKHRIIDSKVGKEVTINGKTCLNLGSLNFLGMVGKPEIEEVAVSTLRKYGVGTCGPRGFYGTMDVHLEIETKIAEFMQCEEAIIYSYGFATVASAIPAYSKRTDVIFCDEGVCFSIQKGILASRSKVRFFKHNDMEDLERLLQEQQDDDKKNPKKAKVTRRFLIVEGLYINHGDICPLPQLVELRTKYKVRIFMDESVSFGVLGKHGRGVTEFYNIPIDEVDLICVSMEMALASVGGFCCGKSYVIDHQRLSGQGYCFSASQPAMTVTAAMKALEILEKTPELLQQLEDNCRYIHSELIKIPQMEVTGTEISPVKHLHLRASSGDRTEDVRTLQGIVQQIQEMGIALTLASYLEDEMFLPVPSIRIAVSCELSKDEMNDAVSKLRTVCDQLL